MLVNNLKGISKDISIIIPNFNGENFLKNCLNSIEKNNSNFNNINIFIIDNGSTDNSKNFLKEKIQNNIKSNIHYEIIFNENNSGFSKAINQGINLSKTEYICLLNNDVEIKDDFLLNLVKCIETDDNIFSVSSKLLRFNNKSVIDDAGDEYTLLGWTKKAGDGKSSKFYSKKREIFSSCAGAAIYRKHVLDKIGYFDENFFAYVEDVDIGYRAKINGYKNLYCPEAIAYHVGSGTSGSKYNKFKIKLSARNNIWMIYKNMPKVQIILNLGFLTTGFLIKYLFFVKKGQGNIYINGLKEGIKNRRKIQKTEFKKENLKNYFKIEYELIINTFKLLIK